MIEMLKRIRLRWSGLHIQDDILKIEQSGLFDVNYYVRHHPTRKITLDSALLHFCRFGVAERRNPHPLFDTDYYLSANPSVKESGENPLVHFIRTGWRQECNPHIWFDVGFYLNTYADVRAAGMNPLVHFLRHGGAEGRDPHPNFSVRFYLNKYPEVTRSGINPLVHYVDEGGPKGYFCSQADEDETHRLDRINQFIARDLEVRDSGQTIKSKSIRTDVSLIQKSGLFDDAFYLTQHPAVKLAGINPIVHYCAFGWKLGCEPSTQYDFLTYFRNRCRDNRALDGENINPVLHFLKKGREQGRILPLKNPTWPCSHRLNGSLPMSNEIRTHTEMKWSIAGESVREFATTERNQVEPWRDTGIAVHLFLSDNDMANSFVSHLENMPFPFDLFVSVSCPSAELDDSTVTALKSVFAVSSNIHRCELAAAPAEQGELTSMVLNFGKSLAAYTFVLHLHSSQLAKEWKADLLLRSEQLAQLMHSKVYLENLFEFWRSEPALGFLYPPTSSSAVRDYGWNESKPSAIQLFKRLGFRSALLSKKLTYPYGGWFWFRPAALEKLLTNKSISMLSARGAASAAPDAERVLDDAMLRSLFSLGSAAGYKAMAVSPMNYSGTQSFGDIESYLAVVRKKFCDSEKVFQAISAAIEKALPFALIRYYDGEGAFYSMAQREPQYQMQRMRYYFGDFQFTDDDIELIAREIAYSVACADVVGMAPPDLLEELAMFATREAGENWDALPHLKSSYDDAIDGDGVWRILSSVQMIVLGKRSSALLCSKDIHYELVLTGHIYRLLASLEEVHIITSQPVKALLETFFYLRVVEYPIPARAFDNDSLSATSHYPGVFQQLMTTLSGDLSGKVFLVGAGPLGKLYCARRKRSGGIALDMGAVMDSWVNFHSRPEHRENDSSVGMNRLLVLNYENIHTLTGGSIPAHKIKVSDMSPDYHINKRLLERYMWLKKNKTQR
jgi:hypothetical protein